jgi:putative phosphoribosyl transferase
MTAVSGGGTESEIKIHMDPVALEGCLNIPDNAKGVVLFVHGSGSSRHSPRNQQVAEVLRVAGIATLLIDLLTPQEERIDIQTAQLRFDIRLLTQRLVGIIDWLAQNADTRGLPIGLFGASTGAAAAFAAAAQRANRVAAIVARGGRPDLAGPLLATVTAPSLLVVGGNDLPVIMINREAFSQLHTEKRLEIVPGAGHLFREPGTLAQVSRLAREWFADHLKPNIVNA